MKERLFKVVGINEKKQKVSCFVSKEILGLVYRKGKMTKPKHPLFPIACFGSIEDARLFRSVGGNIQYVTETEVWEVKVIRSSRTGTFLSGLSKAKTIEDALKLLERESMACGFSTGTQFCDAITLVRRVE